jgi:hypothetical protein
MTPRQMFSDVLQDIGVLGKTDRLDSADAQLALRKANDWIDSLALESMTVYYLLPTTKNLAANTASYTIGSGGAINMVRPTEIESARLIIDVNAATLTEIDVDVYSEQEWQAIPQKGLTSPYVRGVRLDNNWTAGLATLLVWPVPTIATTRLVLYSRQALTEFPSLDVNITYPPGYRQFIRTNLAKQFAPSWGKTLTQEQKENATEARAKVKRSNIRPVEASLPIDTPGLVRGAYDWRLG